MNKWSDQAQIMSKETSARLMASLVEQLAQKEVSVVSYFKNSGFNKEAMQEFYFIQIDCHATVLFLKFKYFCGTTEIYLRPTSMQEIHLILATKDPQN